VVFPSRPYSPHLGESSDGDAVQGPVKRLTLADIEKMRGGIARPFTGAVRSTASQDDIAALKAGLTSNPSADLPAWRLTPPERGQPWAWVPREWDGRTADDFLHLMKETGDLGPLKTRTLGAAGSRGRPL